jgi:hypothetical protein
MNRRACLAALALILAGCSTEKPAVSSVEPFHIADIQVVGPPPEGVTEWQMADLRYQTASYAKLVPETANPRLLRLSITHFHKKNAGMSFIVGDANRLGVSAEVISLDGEQVIGRFAAQVETDGYVNGVIGATMAGLQDRNEAAQGLNRKAASAILEKIYGTKTWKAWAKRRR